MLIQQKNLENKIIIIIGYVHVFVTILLLRVMFLENLIFYNLLVSLFVLVFASIYFFLMNILHIKIYTNYKKNDGIKK